MTTIAEWAEWQRARQRAAVRFQRAANQIRLLTRMAEAAGITDYEAPEPLVHAVRDAEHACVTLGIWAHRQLPAAHHPDRIRRTGDLAA